MEGHDFTDIARAIDTLRSSDTCAADDGGLRELLMVTESLRNAAEALQARVMVEMQRRAHRDDIADSKPAHRPRESPALQCPPEPAKSSSSTRLRSTFTAPGLLPLIGSPLP